MNTKDFKIISSTKTVEFWYNDNYYKYVYDARGGRGFAYIYKGKTKIYGPYENERTDEGIMVYNEYMKNK